MPSRRNFLCGIAGSAALVGLACAHARDRTKTPLPDVGSDLPAPDAEGPALADDPFATLHGFCDGVPAVAQDEFALRRVNVTRLVADGRRSGLVLEAGVDMRYFTGVRWGLSERPLLVALPARGVPFFVGPAFERSRLEESVPTGMELVAWEEHEDPYETLVALARKRGVDPRGLAVGGTTRRFVADGLARAAARSSLLSGGAFVDAARIVKSEHELARLRRVNEATKAAIAAARPLVEPGMTEGELVTLFTAAQRAAGLDEIWVLALVGANAAFPHGTAHGRVVREGEVVLVDTGGALHGYRSDITRTFVVGRANDEVKRAYDTVLAAQSAGLALIRPGEACQRADAAAREVMAAAGYGAGYERFTHRLGHGIGLEVHEPPYLVRGNELVLATGMTMSNEPGIYVPGQFGIRIEDIVAVGAEGPEVFGPRALPLGSD